MKNYEVIMFMLSSWAFFTLGYVLSMYVTNKILGWALWSIIFPVTFLTFKFLEK